jgi:hypothetical protein
MRIAPSCAYTCFTCVRFITALAYGRCRYLGDILAMQCGVSSLCGTSISSKLQGALELLTDYCSIIAECQVR